MTEAVDTSKPGETWIGVVSLLQDGQQYAVAWVRRRDEWLADVAAVACGEQIEKLAGMYIEAVRRRGAAPARLNVGSRDHAVGLKARLDVDIPIEVGFDARAAALSDAATEAVEIAFATAPAFDDSTARYDPECSPDPSVWRALDQSERQRLVRAAHEHSTDLRGRHLQAHVGMHEVIETQLAECDPPETRHALTRLRACGVSRHQAIHTIAAVLVREMQTALTASQPFDVDRYAAELRRLAAE